MNLVRAIFIFLVIIGLGILGYYFYLDNGSKKKSTSPSDTNLNTPITNQTTAVPSEIPSPEITLSPSVTESISPSPSPSSSVLPSPSATPSPSTTPSALPSPSITVSQKNIIKKLDPKSLENLNKGIKHYNSMDYEKGIICFNEVVKINPDDAMAHYYLFLSYAQIEANAWSRKSEAYKEATYVLKLNPDKKIQENVNSYFEDVKNREELAKPSQYPVLSSPIPSTTSSPGSEPVAPPDLNSSSDVPIITSKDADAHFENARNYDKQGNYNYAVAEYSNAIKINPKHTEAYISRGSLYETKGDYKTAISDFSKAIDIKPNNAISYYRRGKAYKNISDKDKAKTDLLKAKELDPSLAEQIDQILKEIDTK